MHFDPRKPHGVVINHPSIRYEQNGRSYDHSGNLYGDPAAEVQEETDIMPVPRQLEPGERDFEREQARDFLINILKEGPLRRAEVYKTASANNQSWEKVKEAFAAMDGVVYNRKNSLYWKLPGR